MCFFSRVVKSPNILVEILSHQGFQAPDPEFVVCFFFFEEGLHGRYIGNKSKKKCYRSWWDNEHSTGANDLWRHFRFMRFMCVFTSFDHRFFLLRVTHQEPAIGVVPAGTGNDLARSLGQGWSTGRMTSRRAKSRKSSIPSVTFRPPTLVVSS